MCEAGTLQTFCREERDSHESVEDLAKGLGKKDKDVRLVENFTRVSRKRCCELGTGRRSVNQGPEVYIQF